MKKVRPRMVKELALHHMDANWGTLNLIPGIHRINHYVRVASNPAICLWARTQSSFVPIHGLLIALPSSLMPVRGFNVV